MSSASRASQLGQPPYLAALVCVLLPLLPHSILHLRILSTSPISQPPTAFSGDDQGGVRERKSARLGPTPHERAQARLLRPANHPLPRYRSRGSAAAGAAECCEVGEVSGQRPAVFTPSLPHYLPTSKEAAGCSSVALSPL